MPEWFRNAKFGIYTHWGPYSVPAYGQNGSWYPNNMYNPESPDHAYHVRTYGPVDKFGYKDLIPMFTAEKFDPDQWAELFYKSGAKFAGPVAEHHDGFAMWDSKLTEWNSSLMGPKRDVVGQLEKAIRAKGMKFMTAFHHAYNWWFFQKGREHGDCMNPEFRKLYAPPHKNGDCPDAEFLNLWRDKIYEVIDNYMPDLIWFDFGLGAIRERYRREMLAYYYNRASERRIDVVTTYKQIPSGNYHLHPMSAVMDLEKGKMNTLTPYPWLTDTSIEEGAWSHVRNMGFKSAERLIHNLIDRVSKNGYLLLNVGPRADGSIPEGAQECLSGIGKWLEVNGEAIFDTVPWLVAEEGPTASKGGDHFNEQNEARFTAQDIRFTTRGNNIYAICLGRPGEDVTIRTFRGSQYPYTTALPVSSTFDASREGRPFLYHEDIASINMLGSDQQLKWKLDEDGLTIEAPRKMPCEHACAFKIVLNSGNL